MVYFTSDLHFNHAKVIQYCARPWTNVDDMNTEMIANWNNTVSAEDTVYCLGDFSLSYSVFVDISSKLNGTKYLVPGNHDHCHSYHKESRNPKSREKWVQKYTDCGWIVLPEQISLEIEGIGTVDLCHHPYTFTMPKDDKYADWRPKDNGRWLLCGHVHEQWKTKDRMINVGVDMWQYKPVSVEEIKKIVCSVTQS